MNNWRSVNIEALQADIRGRCTVREHKLETPELLTSLEWKRANGLAPPKPAKKRKRAPTDYSRRFQAQCRMAGFPVPEIEVRFHPTRKWKFDCAWPDRMIAVEIEGGIWIRGRHNRGAGYLKDMEKYNAAAKLGWRVFRFGTGQVHDLKAIAYMKQVLGCAA